ncbi:HK97 gp10 family phage protein [Streptomyces sp. NBC_00124]|uniref:HK97 gp10 family phage protein n=1 Tax=Streptomyces sp. NBC_00124 TaxID=2975662 RepID=UPI002259FBC6|nr:HK97 gp10 family phage protein [Streptomyces sp. NBC_00124]MCX5365944.1 HK97 gp10 family phage protein [Streptomyces sp. NBC_00124]
MLGATYHFEVNHGWRGWVRNSVTGYLEKLGEAIERDAKRMVPVKSSRLHDSIYSDVDRGKVRVGVKNVPYWSLVEFGAPDHVITPKNKKALYWKGARHPVKRVNHPGNDAQPFLRPALYKRRGRLG